LDDQVLRQRRFAPHGWYKPHGIEFYRGAEILAADRHGIFIDANLWADMRSG
jgi:hypothetical protein